jgi:hypothetical protein
VTALFAEDITASGTITGATLLGSSIKSEIDDGQYDDYTEINTATLTNHSEYTIVSSQQSIDYELDTVLDHGELVFDGTVGGNSLPFTKISLVRAVFGRSVSVGGKLTVGGNIAVAHQTQTVTGTTNSAGNIGLGLTEDYGVIYVRRTDANAICNPWWDLTSQRWIARVTNTDGTALASTSVTLEVAYYDLTTS